MSASMIDRRTLLPLLGLFVLAQPGCRAPQAFGERDSVIVRADAALWEEVGPDMMAALERTVFTSRQERVFTVTFVAPDDTLWNDFRLWQQVVILGTRDDRLVGELLEDSEQPDLSPPAIFEITGRWARAQLISVLLLPREGQAQAARALLPQLYERLLEKYDGWITERMYTTGVNDSLSQVLAGFGFTLTVPKVYMHQRTDSLFRFANPYRQGDTDLLRSLALSWTTGTAEVTPASLRAWREQIDERAYDPPQDILEEGVRFGSVQVAGRTALELRGVWQDRSDFPAAGPFITRAIVCPGQDRTYYMDAWLFAPGTNKYPYLRQLEILLDSFRCTEQTSPAADAGT
ncbi:MAG: hypothetical protein AMS25_07570 [Gemmatimonas sp. SM23_52]|nr:MAG: hypothetical protein AMS25_07570 [Gemmatimonas sp. SM23_52]